jgi:ketosteroid isomerase-like protein
MSQEKIDRVRAGYDALNRGETEADVGLLASDFELRQASFIVDTAGVFYGRGAVRDVVRELEEAFEDLSFEPEEFMESPNGEIVVLVHVRGRGRGSGVEIDNRIAHVWTFRDDRAIRIVVYEEQAEALEATGLGPP